MATELLKIVPATNLEVACISSTFVSANSYCYAHKIDDTVVTDIYFYDGAKPVHFTKYNIYADMLRHGSEIVKCGLNMQKQITE